MKVLAVYNVKGGVGKTTIALDLAHSAARNGRTLLWDLDEQGAASAILGHPPGKRERPRRTYRLEEHIVPGSWADLDLIPSSRLVHLLDRHDRPRHLQELLARQASDYDLVIVDCPPALGLITEQICELADLMVVPVVPSALSMHAYEQLRDYVSSRDGRKPDLLRVLSMVDRRRLSHRELAEQEPETIAIPYAVAVEQMASAGKPLASIAPRSPAVAPLDALWREVQARLDTPAAAERAAA